MAERIRTLGWLAANEDEAEAPPVSEGRAQILRELEAALDGAVELVGGPPTSRVHPRPSPRAGFIAAEDLPELEPDGPRSKRPAR